MRIEVIRTGSDRYEVHLLSAEDDDLIGHLVATSLEEAKDVADRIRKNVPDVDVLDFYVTVGSV